MTLTRITRRKDGKYLVGLHFKTGRTFQKVMTQAELEATKAQVAEDEKREAQYHGARHNWSSPFES